MLHRKNGVSICLSNTVSLALSLSLSFVFLIQAVLPIEILMANNHLSLLILT